MTLEEKLCEFVEKWEGDGVTTFTPSWAKHIKSLLGEVVDE